MVKIFNATSLILLGTLLAKASPGRLDLSFTPTPPPNGEIHAMILLPDGGILVGGEFTEPRTYLAKYRPDGMLDSSFEVSLNGAVHSLDLTLSRNLLWLGGAFTEVNSEPSERLAGLMLDGTLHENSQHLFSPGFDGPVHAVEFVASGSGSLLVGGNFQKFGGQDAGNLVSMTPTSLQSDFRFTQDFRMNGPVKVISPGFLGNERFIGGAFSKSFADPRFGVSANNLAVCSLQSPTRSGLRSYSFSDREVTALLPIKSYFQASGSANLLLMNGSLTSVPIQGNQTVGTALLQSEGYDPAFPSPSFPHSTAVGEDSDGFILAANRAGDLWRFSIGRPRGQSSVAEINSSFLHRNLTRGPINRIIQSPDGKYLIAGDFSTVDGKARPFFAKLFGPSQFENFEEWLSHHGLPEESDPASDPDQDGLALVVEFAFCLNPHAADREDFITIRRGRAYLNPVPQPGVQIRAFFSTDLIDWTLIPIRSDSSLRPPNGTSAERRYFRISVSFQD